ncbi:MAG: hypothetical protein HFJ64_08530 [Eggerthellaceae bacterium]|nr:hypothetical protein [Eggerthellaceae bacterium]
MNLKTELKLSAEYESYKQKILEGYKSNPEAYKMAMIKNRARMQNEPLAYGAIIVLVIGFIWDLVARFIFNMVPSSDSDNSMLVYFSLVTASVVLIIGVLVVFGVLVHYNRKDREIILIEEQVLSEYRGRRIDDEINNVQND